MANETSILQSVLAKAHEKAIPHEVAEAPTKKPDSPESLKTPDPKLTVKPTVATVKPVESEELIAARAKVAELESKYGVASKKIESLSSLERARDLWKQKKRIEAIELLSGIEDIEPELDEFVKDYVASPSKGTKNAVEEKLDKLLEKQEQSEREKEEAKKSEAKAAEDKKKKDADDAAAKAIEDNIRYTNTIVDKHPDQFDLCGREKNRKEVGQKAPIVALECLKRDKVNLETVTPEQAEKAMIEALTEIETDLEKKGLDQYVKKSRGSAQNEEHTKKPEAREPASIVPAARISVSDPKKPANVSDVIEKIKRRAVYQ